MADPYNDFDALGANPEPSLFEAEIFHIWPDDQPHTEVWFGEKYSRLPGRLSKAKAISAVLATREQMETEQNASDA